MFHEWWKLRPQETEWKMPVKTSFYYDIKALRTRWKFKITSFLISHPEKFEDLALRSSLHSL